MYDKALLVLPAEENILTWATFVTVIVTASNVFSTNMAIDSLKTAGPVGLQMFIRWLRFILIYII